jgi:hypothetical protein
MVRQAESQDDRIDLIRSVVDKVQGRVQDSDDEFHLDEIDGCEDETNNIEDYNYEPKTSNIQ